MFIVMLIYFFLLSALSYLINMAAITWCQFILFNCIYFDVLVKRLIF